MYNLVDFDVFLYLKLDPREQSHKIKNQKLFTMSSLLVLKQYKQKILTKELKSDKLNKYAIVVIVIFFTVVSTSIRFMKNYLYLI